MKKLLDHLRYPSTWQGVIALVTAVFGLVLLPEQQEAIVTAGVALYGAVQVLFSDVDVDPK